MAPEAIVMPRDEMLAKLGDQRVRALVKEEALREPGAASDDQELHELATRRAAALRRARGGSR